MKHNDDSYFQNRDCQYFPCHKGAGEDFNCLFCYCPLYALGDQCGGNFRYTDQGVKDCASCLIPHSPGGFEYIQRHYGKIAEIAKQNRRR